MWTPVDHQAIWTAISRATRTPSLYELDGRSNAAAFQVAPDGPSGLFSALPNPTLRSEEVLTYEIGYRYTPARRIAIDISSYLNNYTHIIGYSPLSSGFEDVPTPPHVLLSVMQLNGPGIKTFGAEATLRWQATDALQVTAGYAWIHIDAPANPAVEDDTASQQAQLRAYLDLSRHLKVNTALYYVGQTTDPAGQTSVRIPAYVRADVGVVWRPLPGLSLGIWGRNLVQREHVEFANFFASTQSSQVPRSVLGKVTWSF